MTNTEYGHLPAVRLSAPDGAQATITLFGAHLVSWKGAQGHERLFVSAKSALDGSAAIRGGVPVVFPQFAERGPLIKHGFARVSNWRMTASGIEDGAAFALFELNQSDLAPELAAAWPHAFALALRVAVRDSELAMSLEVRNDGAQAFPFAAALHTYHLVDDIAAVRIIGVEPAALTFTGKHDQPYEGIAGTVFLESGAGKLKLEQKGFTDAVVWNPWAADAAAIPDMGDDEYRRFVCIEPARLGPATLDPCAVWRGEYRVTPA
ncbi:D-hexose-6-phosphate mutarotase [Massilia horti]|uniref:Putative glucose-6-phosphate 1-epimerase n=1 Tax=Massilia horti TaxID=2562153 RepID=A0A4Y9SQ63_9BURK|nr:D-hexose-6-phosphate mutarotase [Massilia horti]